MDDATLFAAARRELFTALVGDTLDRMGLRRQYLGPAFRPVDSGMVILGRAMTVTEADVDAARPGPAFGLLFQALDDLKPGEVYICAGASPAYALWGGLMSTRAIACGAARGPWCMATIATRRRSCGSGFPVALVRRLRAGPGGARARWSPGASRSWWTACGWRAGTWCYGDRDGVLIVPQDAVADAFAGAFEKARGESAVLRALQGGMSTVEAFARFGIM